MFRYVFDPTLCAWVIEVKSGLFWTRVRDQKSDVNKRQARTFADLEAAQKFASEVGLPRHYAEQGSPKDRKAWFKDGVQILMAPSEMLSAGPEKVMVQQPAILRVQ